MNIGFLDFMSLSYLFQFFTEPEHFSFFLFCITFCSLFIGSFLNVVIYRLPRIMQNLWHEECRVYLGLKPFPNEIEKLSLGLPFSHCPHCKKILKPWHNIPIFSYLFLQKKCAYCKANISLRYPAVELLTALSSLFIAWHFGVSPQAFAALTFTWILIALTFIDIDHHLLPDQLTLLLLWTGLFFSLFSLFPNSQDSIIGAIVGYLSFAMIEWLFKLATGKTGMGQGDFKLLAGLGAFLGWQHLPMVILMSSFIGVIFGLIQLLLKRQFQSIPIPFGPYLAIAGWVNLLWGQEILSTYWLYFSGKI